MTARGAVRPATRGRTRLTCRAGRRAVGGAASGLALALVTGACGQAPAAQAVKVPESPISFTIPAAYATLDQGASGTTVYGRPGSSADGLADDPVLYMTTLIEGDAMSFEILRRIATGDQYDPLDPALATLPDGAQVIGYKEITEPKVWGIRLKLAVNGGAKDYQALVDRTTDKVVVTELACTQVCFKRQTKLIEQIQGSWSLES